MNNKIIIAAAGSGKTDYLVKQALAVTDGSVLITTYTENNEKEVKIRINERVGYIPNNITVQTWFSFLLQHGVRPYQGYLYAPDIKGMLFMNEQSVPYTKETDVQKYYFNDDKKIYSDKIAKFVCKCNEKSNNAITNRLAQIYSHIFIDEVQDLAGYDLEVLKLIFNSKITTLLVGDPRQAIYSTNNLSKNKKFKKNAIINFFDDDKITIKKDDETLITNYRCVKQICELSNTLFPDFKQIKSGNQNITDHDGVFLVKKEDVATYLQKYNAVQLRYNKKEIIDPSYSVMNFGESKGLSFDRALIYPTAQIKKWLQDPSTELKPTIRSKLYVAITRARQSVAFVFDCTENNSIEATKWIPPDK